ncbi:hypothetical protein Tco_0417602 [Tanacetum coccineum]
MSNIEKIKFPALDITGANYIQWTGNVKRHLKSMGVLATIQEETKAKADVFLHQHIDETLEFEYSNCDDPCILWKDLETRFNNQREVLLSSARDERNNLRFQDFKKVNEYTSVLFRTCQTLRFCGQTVTEAAMLEKTFSTFHASNINLQQQYRLQNFKRYFDLNVNLLVAEKNNELLIKNHQTRPTGSLALPETNVVNNNDNKNSKSKRGRYNPRGRSHGHGHYGPNRFPNRNYTYHRGGYNGHGRGRGQRNNTYHAPQVNNLNQQNNKVGPTNLIDGVGKANVVLPNGSTMMKRIVENTNGHPLKDQKLPKIDKVPLCTSCSLGKLIARPSPLKVENESPMFLERIQVKRVRLDNAGEFTSYAFNDYCMSIGIVVEHLVSHVHTQNVYVPIAPPQRTKIGPQRRLGIYVGYETSSIIRYIEPLTCDLFTVRFADCHFDEAVFSKLGGVKKNQEKDVTWCEPSLLYLDPRTKQCETEVQKITNLQEIANQLLDAFIDTKRVTKSHIPAANAPARVKIPNKQAGDNIAQESQKRLKRGRPIGLNDKNPRKRKGIKKNSSHDDNVLDETQDIKTSPEEEMNYINKEMSINYSQTHILWDRNEIGDIDEIFSYSIANDIMSGDDDPEPKSVIDCQNRLDWDKWKDAMQAELNSLNKRKVFGPIVTTPRDVKPVGYRWIFVWKRNEKNEVTRYKARLVAQVSKNLEMRLMDFVIAYLYGSLDNDIDSWLSIYLYSNPNTDPNRMPLTKAKGQIPQKDKIHKIESMIKRFRKRYSRVVCPNEAAIEGLGLSGERLGSLKECTRRGWEELETMGRGGMVLAPRGNSTLLLQVWSGFGLAMAEIGCNWARIGPSKSSQSLSNAHKWAVVID